MSRSTNLFKKQPKGFATKAIHIGQDPDQWEHLSVVPPIVTVATFKQYAPGEPKEYKYGRGNNPTRKVLETCLASLDNGKYALAFASGMGAITAISELVSSGENIIACNDLYGGTYRFFQKIAINHGIQIDFVDPTNLPAIKNAIKKNTKLIWLESPSNPSMKIVDIEAVSKLVHAVSKNIIVVVDNSFLSSYFQRPLELGADIAMYSLTKYMNGHSDVIMGAASTNSGEIYERLRFIQNATGIVPSPFDCYQVNRGLKTLVLRMERHHKSALTVAEFLESHPNVEKVLHPGLPSHPQHKLALQQCYGHSGVMSFYIKGGIRESLIFFKTIKLFIIAESLGGYESLAELPTRMSHASIPVAERELLGITDSMVRISIGLEDVEDIINDLDVALRATTAG